MKRLDKYPEEKKRMDRFAEIVKLINQVNTLSMDLCDYPEFNAILMSIKDMEEGFRQRINSIAKTMDARHLIYVHQLLETMGT